MSKNAWKPTRFAPIHICNELSRVVKYRNNFGTVSVPVFKTVRYISVLADTEHFSVSVSMINKNFFLEKKIVFSMKKSTLHVSTLETEPVSACSKYISMLYSGNVI